MFGQVFDFEKIVAHRRSACLYGAVTCADDTPQNGLGQPLAGVGLPGYRCPWHAHNAGEIYSLVEVATYCTPIP